MQVEDRAVEVQAEVEERAAVLLSGGETGDGGSLAAGRVTLADPTGKRLQACFDLPTCQRTETGTLIAAPTVDRARAIASVPLGLMDRPQELAVGSSHRLYRRRRWDGTTRSAEAGQ